MANEKTLTSTNDQPLSRMIESKATMAMPEMVSVFISKYEDSLYQQKADLGDELTTVRSQREAHDKTVLGKADFSKWDGLEMPQMRLKSRLAEQVTIKWTNEHDDTPPVLKTTVYLDEIDEDGTKRDTGFRKSVTQEISIADVTTFHELRKKEEELKHKLAVTVASIGDMARKERQVKARISELRLEEAGLSDLLQDAQMQKLIQVK